MSIHILTSQTGGRLANQLYFVLQAFRLQQQLKMPVKYTQVNSIAPQTLLGKYVDDLNISEFFVEHAQPNLMLQLNYYYQDITKDFSIAELSQFIRSTILKSKKFSCPAQFDINTTAAIHIRNGDYLNLPQHNCFDRRAYLERALALLPSRISTIDVFSDDNNINMREYSTLIKTHVSNVNFVCGTSVIDDFCQLSMYKTKILWNSTFSYWTSFIADERYDATLTICPQQFMHNVDAATHCKPNWILV